MHGKGVDFDKVLGMIDDMVGLLKKEQVDDDKKKAYCAKAFDEAEDEKKELSRSEDDMQKTMADEKEMIASLAEEIEALESGIKGLDKSVAQATENRKKENAAYVEELAASNAAVEIIGIAKNRMNKFYNPKLVQISTHMHSKEDGAPPPPPATVDAYNKKSGESNGVIAMMDTLVTDLQKEIQEMKHDEKTAQKSYEEFMADSSAKRAADAKSLAEKEAAKADTAAKVQKHGEELKATVAELYANAKYTHNLHGECDWLVQNFDVRKSARTGEMDSLTKAKAVLSGADYSL
jgi:septal ring factor EnvC (AmiA/AmiB activator)